MGRRRRSVVELVGGVQDLLVRGRVGPVRGHAQLHAGGMYFDNDGQQEKAVEEVTTTTTAATTTTWSMARLSFPEERLPAARDRQR